MTKSSDTEIWEGYYTCEVEGCNERIYLLREEPGMEGWQAQVLHDHDTGAWTVAVFRHKKGQRYWKEVKALREKAAEDHRARVKARRSQAEISNASRGASQSDKFWGITPGRSTPTPTDGSTSGAPSTTTGMRALGSTTTSESSTAMRATSEETSSMSSATPSKSSFLKRLQSSRGDTDEA